MSDRLTDLPDELSYHILSFLDISDFTRFGCVSKRCSELHFSTPSLNFDLMSGSIVFASSCERRTRVLNSLDRYLSRRGNKKIKSFCVRLMYHRALEWDSRILCVCMDDYFRVLTWAVNAMRCKAEVLELDLAGCYKGDNAVVAPSSILHSGSLKILHLLWQFHFPIIFRTPPSTFSSNLQRLVMRKVDLDEGFFKWISSSCKCIKHLTIQTAHSIENITIQSSSLESFYYEYLQFEGGCIHLNIFAPNLKCMTWKGNKLCDQNLQSLTSLEKLHYSVDLEQEYKIVSGVLRNTDRVTHLILNKDVVMVLDDDSRPDLKPNLRNVCHFCLQSEHEFDDTLVPALVSLFRGMQNLHTLKIFCYPSDNVRTKFDTRFWREQNLAFIHELEEVDIDLCRARTGLMFARYILENAHQLKIMRICPLPVHEKVVVSELNKSRKASNATVVLEEELEYYP